MREEAHYRLDSQHHDDVEILQAGKKRKRTQPIPPSSTPRPSTTPAVAPKKTSVPLSENTHSTNIRQPRLYTLQSQWHTRHSQTKSRSTLASPQDTTGMVSLTHYPTISTGARCPDNRGRNWVWEIYPDPPNSAFGVMV